MAITYVKTKLQLEIHIVTPNDWFQIALLRRAVEKFKSQLANETGSVCSSASPKNSATSAYHRITPTSPSYSTVTTSAIVNNHDLGGGAPVERGAARRASSRNSARPAHTTSREVKWKDNEKAAIGHHQTSPSPGSTSTVPYDQESWKEVNYNLTRLDRKIVHLETLLARFTETLHQAAMNNNTPTNNNSSDASSNPGASHERDQSSAI